MNKTCFSLTAIFLTLATPCLAQSVSGTYLLKWNEICQAVQKVTNTTQSGIQLQSVDPGGTHQDAGYATFTPSKTNALTGALSLVMATVDGSLLITGLPGPPATPDAYDMKVTPANAAKPQTGTYTITQGSGFKPGTINFTLSSGKLSLTLFFGATANGVYKDLQMIGIETGTSKACSVNASLSHL